jgi:PAS domain S-box-containing protein
MPISRDSLERASGEFDQGTFERVGEDGILRLYAFRSLRLREKEPPYLYLFAGIPKNAIVHRANIEMLRNLSVLSIAAFFAVCLAWLFGNLAFVRPINHLLDATRRFGKGEIKTRTGLPHTQDEIGQLAESFDDMASLVETRSMERWSAEEALRESEERYRNISSSISDFAFSCIKPPGGGYAINWLVGAVEGITGYSIREIMENRRWWPIVHPEDKPIFDKHVLGLEPGSSGQCELRIIHKDGSTRWIRAASQVAGNSGFLDPHHLFGSCEDITERKRAEDKLMESQRRLLQIIEFLPDAILVIDKEGKVLAWNLAMEAMTGVKAEEMIGKGNYEYSLPFYGVRRPILIDIALHPNQEMENRYTAIQRRENILFGEAFVPCLAPGNIHLSATASVLRNSKGEVIAGIECVRDNTERRKLEERLQRAEKMEALGTMAGGVAHDLNNVLGIIVGYSEMLLYDLDKSSPQRSHAMEVLKGGQRAAAIVQDLLTLARRGVPSRTVLNLNDVIKEFQSSPEFVTLCSYHPGVRIKTDLDPDLLNVPGSAIHLGKSLMNLLFNAAEAMRDGGALTVKTANCYLDKPISGHDEVRQGDYVVLSVSDTGEGIPASDLKRIFEPFYTKIVLGRSGTGLGLAVVWGSV